MLLCFGLCEASSVQAATPCTTSIKILASGSSFKDYEEVNQRIGALEYVRKLIFLDEHNPHKALLEFGGLINKKDSSLADIGSFKKVKESFTDTNGKRKTRAIEVFEYKSGKERLYIKLPVEKDSIDVATFILESDAHFAPRYPIGIVYEQWKGKPIILLTDFDRIQFEAAKTSNNSYLANEMEKLVAFTESIDGDLNNLLKQPDLLPFQLISLRNSPSIEELRLASELVAKLGGDNSKMIKALDELSNTLENEYRGLSLEFIFAQNLPSLKDMAKLAKVEKKLRNGQIEFGDGDLFLRLISEKPYQLWVRENEGIEYVIEKSSLRSKTTKILFGVKETRSGLSTPTGSVSFDGQQLIIERDVKTYDIGRLKFPLELIQDRLSE